MRRPPAGLLALLALTGCANSTPPPRQSLDQRVDQAFARDAEAIGEKEHIPPPSPAHLAAGTLRLGDGTRVSLWVSDPAANAGAISRCFYLDMETPDGDASGYGGCGGGSALVSLSRNGQVVIGDVGTSPARQVRIESAGVTAEREVIGGYFLVPLALVGRADSRFTLTLLDARARPVGIVRDLTATGSATPAPS